MRGRFFTIFFVLRRLSSREEMVFYSLRSVHPLLEPFQVHNKGLLNHYVHATRAFYLSAIASALHSSLSPQESLRAGPKKNSGISLEYAHMAPCKDTGATWRACVVPDGHMHASVSQDKTNKEKLMHFQTKTKSSSNYGAFQNKQTEGTV